MNDKDFGDLRAEMDQAVASMKEMAPLLASMHRGLVEEGVSNKDASVIVGQYMATMSTNE